MASLLTNDPKRYALVIGNNYPGEVGELNGCVHDANAMQKVLRECGFQVTKKTNLTRDQMVAELCTFGRQLSQGDVALVYFSGHGMEYDGIHFYSPCKMPTSYDEDDIKNITLSSLDVRIALMNKVGTGFKFIISDAC